MEFQYEVILTLLFLTVLKKAGFKAEGWFYVVRLKLFWTLQQYMAFAIVGMISNKLA